jgi:hypothetical protein
MALGLLRLESGDFGTSPFFEQLSGESLLTLSQTGGGAGIEAQWHIEKLNHG